MYNCLMNFELDNLVEYEDDLILSLVTGLNEENEEVLNKVEMYLENFGQRRKNLFDKYKKWVIKILIFNNCYELFRKISKFVWMSKRIW